MTRNPPAPLYTDPVHGAPTDPTVIEGPDGRWWMFYTQRRADDTGPGVAWVHGTDIARACSSDGGLTWSYAGVVDGLDPHPGRNTLWAPEVVFAEGRFHLFVTHVIGVPSQWSRNAISTPIETTSITRLSESAASWSACRVT